MRQTLKPALGKTCAISRLTFVDFMLALGRAGHNVMPESARSRVRPTKRASVVQAIQRWISTVWQCTQIGQARCNRGHSRSSRNPDLVKCRTLSRQRILEFVGSAPVSCTRSGPDRTWRVQFQDTHSTGNYGLISTKYYLFLPKCAVCVVGICNAQ